MPAGSAAQQRRRRHPPACWLAGGASGAGKGGRREGRLHAKCTRMPPHGEPPASYSSQRLATRLPSGLATMQMGNFRRKPGAIVFPGARLRAHAEVEFGSDAPSRRVSLIATSVTTSQPTSPPVLRFVLKDLDSSFSHPPTSYSNVYLLTTRW